MGVAQQSLRKMISAGMESMEELRSVVIDFPPGDNAWKIADLSSLGYAHDAGNGRTFSLLKTSL